MLRRICCMLLLLTGLCAAVQAQMPTDKALIGAMVRCLQAKDTLAYSKLLPRKDILRQWLPELNAHASRFRDKPTYLSRDEARDNFGDALKWGMAEGLHWRSSIFLRFRLDEAPDGMRLRRDESNLSVFHGYIFMRDQKTGKIFGISVGNILLADGKWYAGEITAVLESKTIEDFSVALKDQKRLVKMQTGTVVEDPDGDGGDDAFLEVVERKYYRGYFDEETPIELYVRYMKGSCPEPVCSYQALFRVEEEKWVRMDVAKTPEGTWIFSDARSEMQLSLEGQEFNGFWSANNEKTEYDTRFKEQPISPANIQKLEDIMTKLMAAQ